MVLTHYVAEQAKHINNWLDLKYDSDGYFSYVYSRIPKVGVYCHLVNRILIKLKANDTKYLLDKLAITEKSNLHKLSLSIMDYLFQYYNHKQWECKPIFIDLRYADNEVISLKQIMEFSCRFHFPLVIWADRPIGAELNTFITYLGKRNLLNIICCIPSLKEPICNVLYKSSANLLARIRLLKSCKAADIPVTVVISPIIPFINAPDLDEILKLVIEYTNRIKMDFVSLEEFELIETNLLPFYLTIEEQNLCRTYVNNYYGLISLIKEEEQFRNRYNESIASFKKQFKINNRAKRLNISMHKNKKSLQRCFF